jgi:hypothetical protein
MPQFVYAKLYRFRDWSLAKSWLVRELNREEENGA